MRKGIVACTLVAAAFAGTLTACGDDSSSSSPASAPGRQAGSTTAAAGGTVAIKTFQFTPHELVVEAGTTVTFENDDAILHTVTSGTRKGENTDTPDGRFDIELKDAGTTGSFTFAKAGTYTYYCRIHPGAGMTGEVVAR